MIIIYNCYGGTHSSILASAIHLGILPNDRIPSKKEILDLKFFNKLNYSDMGKLFFHGIDEAGNRIYTIGRGTSKALIPAMRNMAAELKTLYNIDDCFVFINASPIVPASMTLGGFFSRGLKIHFIGVPLLAIGARKNYHKVLDLVKKAKKACEEKPAQCTIVDIDGKGRLSYYS
ncbi:MAG: DUF3189 family protein [Bacillota bacterium]